MKVLMVVEDDMDMRQLISIALNRDPRMELLGSASSAAEAIEAARREDVDLIILDHFIEGDVMGLEAAPALKAAAPRAKILLFTSHDLSAEVRQEPAVDGFLLKRDMRRLLPTCLSLLGLPEPVR